MSPLSQSSISQFSAQIRVGYFPRENAESYNGCSVAYSKRNRLNYFRVVGFQTGSSIHRQSDGSLLVSESSALDARCSQRDFKLAPPASQQGQGAFHGPQGLLHVVGAYLAACAAFLVSRVHRFILLGSREVHAWTERCGAAGEWA